MKSIFTTILMVGLFATTLAAQAQDQRNQSWQFKGQNRASIAAMIRSVENEDKTATGGYAAYPAANYTNLVCGKDGQSSASGNTTCVILHNSNGTVDVGQESNGNQTANSQTESSVDDVLDTLTGEDTGIN